MKKWLVLAAVAAAAVLVAQKLMPMQKKNDADIVTDVIYDDDDEAPVETSEPSPIVPAPVPETIEDVPPETLIDTENS